MIALRKVKDHQDPLQIDAVQTGNEVHLVRHGDVEPFVIVKRDKDGNAVVGINDADTGCRDWKDIATLMWRR